MATFYAQAEGRGRPVGRTGSAKTGVRAMAGTWSVRGEAGAFWDNPEMGGNGAGFALRVQALRDSGGKLHGGVDPKGEPFELWSGTEREALALTGEHGPHAAAQSRVRAALRLLAEASNAVGNEAGHPKLAAARKAAQAAAVALGAL